MKEYLWMLSAAVVIGALKVGSLSFEGIIFLLIYFLNCRKALFKKEWVTISKKYRVKSIRLAVLGGIP